MQTKIELNQLEGKWHVVQSNFAMWLKGDKINPTFNYTIESKYGITGLKDAVTYLKNGKEVSIKGFDMPANELNTSFIWRSSFLFGWVKSRWQILYYDVVEEWAIIRFSKTLFTKAGEDVIVRDVNIADAIQKSIDYTLKEFGIADLKRL